MIIARSCGSRTILIRQYAFGHRLPREQHQRDAAARVCAAADEVEPSHLARALGRAQEGRPGLIRCQAIDCAIGGIIARLEVVRS